VSEVPRSTLGLADGETPLNVDGRPLSARGLRTRRALLDAAETVFLENGYHEASIVKITALAGVAQGTFYLYFPGKREIFTELVLDLNARVRHFVDEASAKGATRVEQELLGFRAFFRFMTEHPALYRVIRQAEMAVPEALHEHYRRFSEGYVEHLRAAMDTGEIAETDPEILAWVLMGAAELLGLRMVAWGDGRTISDADFEALEGIIRRTLGA
jgi:AcrR family transcriptional regulator